MIMTCALWQINNNNKYRRRLFEGKFKRYTRGSHPLQCQNAKQFLNFVNSWLVHSLLDKAVN